VVPELASRDHVRKLIPLMNQLLEESGKKSEIDAGIYAWPWFDGCVDDRRAVWSNFGLALNKSCNWCASYEGAYVGTTFIGNAARISFCSTFGLGGHSQLMASWYCSMNCWGVD
jgi:N6-L-threonylcarbamoyladenine synthase